MLNHRNPCGDNSHHPPQRASLIAAQNAENKGAIRRLGSGLPGKGVHERRKAGIEKAHENQSVPITRQSLDRRVAPAAQSSWPIHRYRDAPPEQHRVTQCQKRIKIITCKSAPEIGSIRRLMMTPVLPQFVA